jgi:hypothetical protein
MPDVRGLDAEASVDVWLNNFGIEVMIWVLVSPGWSSSILKSG